MNSSVSLFVVLNEFVRPFARSSFFGVTKKAKGDENRRSSGIVATERVQRAPENVVAHDVLACGAGREVKTGVVRWAPDASRIARIRKFPNSHPKILPSDDEDEQEQEQILASSNALQLRRFRALIALLLLL
jgi:hypothetical protein